MTRLFAKRLLTYLLLTVATVPLGAAAWEHCDGVPIRPMPNPIVFRPNGCSFQDLSNSHGLAVNLLAREGAEYWTTHVLPPTWPTRVR